MRRQYKVEDPVERRWLLSLTTKKQSVPDPKSLYFNWTQGERQEGLYSHFLFYRWETEPLSLIDLPKATQEACGRAVK